MSKFLVIGGAGFIGSHLCDYLLAHGHQVYCYDNCSTGCLSNIERHRENKNFRYYSNSQMFDNIDLCLLISQCDYIYHLAGSVGVKYVDENPQYTMLNNLNLAKLVFECNSQFGNHKPIFFASTSEVYGNSDMVPFKEDSDCCIGSPDKLRWGYSCSKLMSEFLLRSYEFPFVIGRFFNVVGPRQVSNYGMVIPTFVEHAVSGKDLCVYGDGTQTRCFCSVYDAIKAIYSLLVTESCHYETFNIGSMEEVTIFDVAQRIHKLYGTGESKVVLTPYSESFSKNHSDVFRRVPDTSKINQYLGWTPKHNLDAILDMYRY